MTENESKIPEPPEGGRTTRSSVFLVIEDEEHRGPRRGGRNMTGGGTDSPPPAVHKLVGMIVDQALSRCDRLGITWEDFDRAIREEVAVLSDGNVPRLIRRAFDRLGHPLPPLPPGDGR